MTNRNLTIRQVAVATKLSNSRIHRIRNGKIPKLDTLEQLAKGLHVRMTDLFESEYK